MPNELQARWQPRLTLLMMLVLTFVTGVVDAVGFLALDRVFVGNMTGNIVILGMAVAAGDELPVVGPAIALGTFTAGAFVAGWFLRARRKTWSSTVTALLTVGGLVLAVLAVAYQLPGTANSYPVQLSASTSMAAVMGVQAAVARSLAVVDMTTVVVTSTLTSLASESLIAGGVAAVWNRRLGAIVIIFAGACVGTLLLHVHMTIALGFAAALTFTVAGTGHWNHVTHVVAQRPAGVRV